jgi:hypothetical protein
VKVAILKIMHFANPVMLYHQMKEGKSTEKVLKSGKRINAIRVQKLREKVTALCIMQFCCEKLN